MKTKPSPALKRPIEIKRGNVIVKVYAGKLGAIRNASKL